VKSIRPKLLSPHVHQRRPAVEEAHAGLQPARAASVVGMRVPMCPAFPVVLEPRKPRIYDTGGDKAAVRPLMYKVPRAATTRRTKYALSVVLWQVQIVWRPNRPHQAGHLPDLTEPLSRSPW
jgi:hypothetical protein